MHGSNDVHGVVQAQAVLANLMTRQAPASCCLMCVKSANSERMRLRPPRNWQLAGCKQQKCEPMVSSMMRGSCHYQRWLCLVLTAT